MEPEQLFPDSPELMPKDAYLSWIEVDLGAMRRNVRTVQRLLQPTTALFAVIKADAYGHGAVRAARALADEHVEVFCVARVEEALELRAAGIDKPLLVFAPPLAGQVEPTIQAHAAAVISSAS